MFWNICYGLISFSWIMLEVQCQLRNNTPATMWLGNRFWKIPESKSVGTWISQAHSRDYQGDPLIYGLEPMRLEDPELPFRIDPDTGTVYLNDTLQGRAGENISLLVTVSDGVMLAKYEIFVNIVKGSTSSFLPSAPPSLFNANIMTVTIVSIISACTMLLVLGIFMMVFRKKIHLRNPKGFKYAKTHI